MTAINKYQIRIQANALSLLQMLVHVDLLTVEHSLNVAFIMKMLVMECVDTGMDKENCFYFSLLHDIGKLLLPEFVFKNHIIKNQKEMKIIKKHPEYSKLILENRGFSKDIIYPAYAHHERYDGSGYPLGNRCNDIPKAARLLAIIDSFCAMTEKRLYRKERNAYEAINELFCCVSKYDSKLLEIFTNNADWILLEASGQVKEFKNKYQNYFRTC